MGHICDYKSVVTWSLCQPRVAQTYSPLPPLSAMLIKLGVNLRLVQSVAIWINCSCGNSLIIEDEPESTGRNMFTPLPPSRHSLFSLIVFTLHSFRNPTAIQANRPKDDNKMRQHKMEAKNEAEPEIPLVTNSPSPSVAPSPLLPLCHNKTFLFDLNVSW